MTIHSQAQPWSLSRNHAEEIVKAGQRGLLLKPMVEKRHGKRRERSMWSEWGDSSRAEALAKEDRLPPWHGEGSNEGTQSRKEVQATRQRVASGGRRRYSPWSRCERWLALGIIHTRASPWWDGSTVAWRSSGLQALSCGSDGNLRKQRRRVKKGWRRWWISTIECSNCIIYDNREAKAIKEESRMNWIVFNGYHSGHAIDNITTWLLRERNKSASWPRMFQFYNEHCTLQWEIISYRQKYHRTEVISRIRRDKECGA